MKSPSELKLCLVPDIYVPRREHSGIITWAPWGSERIMRDACDHALLSLERAGFNVLKLRVNAGLSLTRFLRGSP